MLATRTDHASLFHRYRPTPPARSSEIDGSRLADTHQAYAARRVPRNCIATLIRDGSEPAPGDLVLGRVETVGRFDFAELASSTMTAIGVGDEIIACYAPTANGDLMDASSWGSAGDCQLVNPAGIISRLNPRSHAATRTTRVKLLGRLGDRNSKPLNISDWAIPSGLGLYVKQPVIAVIGERNLPGEPCRSVDLIRGLASVGYSVGAANITGVPGCWKVRLLRNAGASLAVDITDAGYVGTFGQDPFIMEKVFLSLTGYLATTGADVIVIEIEQEVFGRDTASIVSMPNVQNRISTIILQGQAGAGAELERDSLRALGYDVTLVDEPGQQGRYHRII